MDILIPLVIISVIVLVSIKNSNLKFGKKS
jgi:hypothetical protein